MVYLESLIFYLFLAIKLIHKNSFLKVVLYFSLGVCLLLLYGARLFNFLNALCTYLFLIFIIHHSVRSPVSSMPCLLPTAHHPCPMPFPIMSWSTFRLDVSHISSFFPSLGYVFPYWVIHLMIMQVIPLDMGGIRCLLFWHSYRAY